MFLFLTNGEKNNLTNKELKDICDKHYSDIYNFYVGRVDISYVGDMTNDVFELFCKKWKELTNENYKSWLYTTANNLLKNFYKTHKRKIQKETYIDEPMAETLSYEENFEIIFENVSDEKIEEYKNEILEILSEKERQLFDMNYVEKLPHNQICEKLLLSEEALNKRLYRLKQKIIAKIKEKSNQL